MDGPDRVSRFYDVPKGWASSSVSRKPLRLVNSYAFSKSSTPPPDQWTHFAKVMPVPWGLVALFFALAVLCAAVFYGMITQFWHDLVSLIFVGTISGAGTFFFGLAVVRSLTSHRARTGWPGMHGVGLSRSGVSFRMAGGDSDVPWDAIASIRAMWRNEGNSEKAQIPVVRIEYAGSKIDLNNEILGASPIVLFWALIYYWTYPATRDELGTSTAQQRMDQWLAELPAPAAPMKT